MLRKFLIALAGLGLLASITTHVDAGLLTVHVHDVSSIAGVDNQFNAFFTDTADYSQTGGNTSISVGGADLVQVVSGFFLNLNGTSTGETNQPHITSVTSTVRFESGPQSVLVTLFQDFSAPAPSSQIWTLVNTLVGAGSPTNIEVLVRSFVVDDVGGAETTTVTGISQIGDADPTTAQFTRNAGSVRVGTQIVFTSTGGLGGIEDVSASTAVVPEPTTLALWGAFGGLAFVGRGLRRRKTTA